MLVFVVRARKREGGSALPHDFVEVGRGGRIEVRARGEGEAARGGIEGGGDFADAPAGGGEAENPRGISAVEMANVPALRRMTSKGCAVFIGGREPS